jgi:hypothetical protein
MRIEQGQHECSGPWFVVNMKRRWNGGLIERSRKPTFVHVSLSSAFSEAKRLSELHPKAHYGVFECIGYVKGVPKKAVEDIRCEYV